VGLARCQLIEDAQLGMPARLCDIWDVMRRAGTKSTIAAKASLISPRILFAIALGSAVGCAPRITNLSSEKMINGRPGNIVSLSFEYLVGWPRIEIADKIIDWPQLKLIAADPARKDVPGEELVWIEDKVLQFKIPDLPPADYRVIIHDDKGPPGDPVYSVLETTAYVVFPPVWPFVFRSNRTELTLRILPVQ
jgi:hypothetical protein